MEVFPVPDRIVTVKPPGLTVTVLDNDVAIGAEGFGAVVHPPPEVSSKGTPAELNSR